MNGTSSSIRMTSLMDGSEPHTTGLTASSGSSVPSRTTAPAASPKRTHEERSSQSVTAVSFSAPTTMARVALPVRMAMSAWARAYSKPEQAVLTSMAAGAAMPRASATRQAVLGQTSLAETVATMTMSMSPGP